MPHIQHSEIDKSVADLAEYFVNILADPNCDKPTAMTKLFGQFGYYLKSNLDDDNTGISDDDIPTPLLEKLKQFVLAMITVNPSKSEQEHLYELLHSPWPEFGNPFE
jgi:hypothetical protein